MELSEVCALLRHQTLLCADAPVERASVLSPAMHRRRDRVPEASEYILA